MSAAAVALIMTDRDGTMSSGLFVDASAVMALGVISWGGDVGAEMNLRV